MRPFTAAPHAMQTVTRLVRILLSCLLIACAPTTGSEGADTRSDTPAQASAPRTNAPERSRATRAADDNAASSHRCSADEYTVFSCQLAGSTRIVSLCLAKQGEHARYVAGGAHDPELTHSGPFRRTSLAYAGGTGGYAYSFEHDGQTRVLYSVSGEEHLARSGELVLEDGAVPVADAPCEPVSLTETDDLAALQHVRSWPAHAHLARHGLPQLEP